MICSTFRPGMEIVKHAQYNAQEKICLPYDGHVLYMLTVHGEIQMCQETCIGACGNVFILVQQKLAQKTYTG